MANLSKQDFNLQEALGELDKLRLFVKYPNKIVGGPGQKHGEIAEHAHVRINNARDHVVGDDPSHTILMHGKERFHKVDFMRGDTPIQSKFLAGKDIRNVLTSNDGIKGHLEKYPDFIKEGGIYQVPKNQYEETIKLLAKPKTQLKAKEITTINKIREFEEANNVKFEDVIELSIVDYRDVQLGKITDTIDKEETNIDKLDDIERAKYQLKAKPTFKQGAKVAAISAAIEGALSFGTSVYGKFSEGKKLNEFTTDDWKDIFKDTGVGTLRGGARGASLYALTNLTKIGAPAATAIITLTFGAMDQTIKYAKGEINQDEYINGLQRIGAETAVAGVGAYVGQMLIPVPVVGAIIGSLVSTCILGAIEEATNRDLADAQFLRAIEGAYFNAAQSIYESSLVFEEALRVLETQRQDYMHKQQLDMQLSGDLNALLDSI